MSWSVIDISYYQSISNYTTLANAVDGVILRCGYRGYGSSGTLVKDSALETHYNGLKGKTKLGYYWFSQAISDAEARAEADYVIDTLLSGKQNDMPIYFDSEIADTSGYNGRADKLSKAARTQYCKTWIQRIQARGYRAGVYASESWFNSNLNYSELLATGASIWIAKYSNSAPSQSTYDAWQWTSSATVPGLSPRFDKSTFYTDVANWGGGGGSIPVTGVKISDTAITVAVGKWKQLSAHVLPTNATNQGITWEAENSSIASVDSSGWVQGVSKGTAKVWAEASENPQGIWDTCTVTVTSGAPEGVNVSSDTVEVGVGETRDVLAAVYPSDAEDREIVWESENPAICTVSSTGSLNEMGHIKGVSVGSCKVWAEAHYDPQNIWHTIYVTVTQGAIRVTGVSLNKSSIKLEKGSSETLVATVTPSDAENKSVLWSSSNSSVASVDSSGNVTAVGRGSCNITVTTVDGGYTATCAVAVIVYPTSVSVEPTEITHIINESDIEVLNALLEPADCTETDITWSSTNNDIAYRGSDGNIVYPGDPGECYITATDVLGHQATCKITVYIRQLPPDPPIIASTSEDSIWLEEIEYGEYSIDDGLNWKTYNIFSDLQYNHKYIFTQRLGAHGYYLESKKSNYSEAYTKDIIHVESIELTEHELNLDITNGSVKHQFEYEILPEEAAIRSVFFVLNNTSIGYINKDGILSVNSPGEGVVTVTAIDGGITDECIVKVYKQWATPEAPFITGVTKNSVTVACDDITLFSLDNGKTWVPGPTIEGLNPRTTYNIICKTIAEDYMTESKPSSPTIFVTPETDPDPSSIVPDSITLSAHDLYFDLNKNTYATLNYIILPTNVKNKNVVWFSSDSNIVEVSASGELFAKSLGKAMIFVKTIYGGVSDHCECYVYKTLPRPEPPTLKEVTQTTIELNPIENGEYSMDCENWRETPFFDGLVKDSQYTLYQRTRGTDDWQPPSEASYGLTVKTLTDETPGGESPSGYTWGQEVDIEKIPIYTSPYAMKSTLSLTGRYYIFNLIESNHRIRITDNTDFLGVYGHSIGWVNIADLKLIVNEIYEGDKVIVNGDINIYADGTGQFIHKDKAEMYVTDIIIGGEYMYGVTNKPGMDRIAFAKASDVTKYKVIEIK
jgi:uncharacterized protein YjdB